MDFPSIGLNGGKTVLPAGEEGEVNPSQNNNGW